MFYHDPLTSMWGHPLRCGRSLGLILVRYMQMGPCVHVDFLSCGPSNPWEMILSHW